MKEPPYNPLAKHNLGESVAEALLARPIQPLPPFEPFGGAGIYAIYYTGPFEPYRKVAELNEGERFVLPIYVGKAVPAGARKGAFGLDTSPGQVLFLRLKEHAESIESAENLKLSDFSCRYLTVDDIWIPLGESLLISKFAPAWNSALGGFGNHDPGNGRYKQQRSAWDVVHPGRSWANRCAQHSKTSAELLVHLQHHISEEFGKREMKIEIEPKKN